LFGFWSAARNRRFCLSFSWLGRAEKQKEVKSGDSSPHSKERQQPSPGAS
jgi:hypothetical protein